MAKSIPNREMNEGTKALVFLEQPGEFQDSYRQFIDVGISDGDTVCGYYLGKGADLQLPKDRDGNPRSVQTVLLRSRNDPNLIVRLQAGFTLIKQIENHPQTGKPIPVGQLISCSRKGTIQQKASRRNLTIWTVGLPVKHVPLLTEDEIFECLSAPADSED